MGKYGTSLYEKGIIFYFQKLRKRNSKGREPCDYKQSKEGNTLGFMPAILLVALTLNPLNHQLRQQSPKFARKHSRS